MKKYLKTLFIFRRDLRLNDNTGLINALKESKSIIPCFIFDPRQITNKNKYISNNAIQFMIDSIKDLDRQLNNKNAKIYLFYGIAENIVEQLIKDENINAVFFNKDYTPFSIKRDQNIENICKKYKVACKGFNDILIIDPVSLKTVNKATYKIFTPFLKKAMRYDLEKPKKNNYKNYYKKLIKNEKSENIFNILKTKNKNINNHGGSQNAAKILRSLKIFKNYNKQKNIPSIKTTNLSAHLKFGTCSIRQVYHSIIKILGHDSDLIRQLYWRDFFTYIAFHNPKVFIQSYKEQYKNLSWSTDKTVFQKWCSGNTGFPIIDAGMRQLNKTGFIHNRIRLIVASFLVKDLHINWQWGEKYFANKLVDYDPAVNNGNWQWCASTGSDAQPYFRIFNPWLQQKKFDKDCVYIKTWVKELKKIEPKIIHSLYKNNFVIKNYPTTIVKHEQEVKVSKRNYQYSI